MPAGETFLPLAVDFADNRKVRALMRFGREARQARDLYVQMLCHCKSTMSDGFVQDEQVGLLVYPDSEKIGRRDADRLAEVGLIDRADNGWTVTGWLERNPSRKAIREKSEAKARGARLANHRRWHEDTPARDCEWCEKESLKSDQTSDQSSDQTSDPSSITTLIGAAKRSDSTYTETETYTEAETETRKPSGRQAGPVPGSDDDPDFAAFWDSYPRKVAKGDARKAWKTAITKRRADPKTVILAAERYRDNPERRRAEIKYTAHPATWLNGERWIEQAETAPRPSRPKPFWEN